jgi:transcriptional regulator GlxA family with amidase domain
MKRSRLCGVTDWAQRAKAASYKVHRLAKNCQVSISQLQRFFMAKTGKTPYEWMRDLRQMQALEGLYHTTKMVKELAYELGFKRPGNFTKQVALMQGAPRPLCATLTRIRAARSASHARLQKGPREIFRNLVCPLRVGLA